MEDCREAWKHAKSMENREAWGAAHLGTEYIGSSAERGRVYDFYRDSEGDYWYTVRLPLADGTLVPERKAVFNNK